MIRLIVDSSADYSLAELKEKNIELVPLSITLDGKSYLDNVELERNSLYEMLAATTDFPKTSQPSPDAFASLFQEAKNNHDEVICLTLSSALSGTFQSANIAKDMVEYDAIHIIDSSTATFGIKLLADYADYLRNQGSSALEIVEKVEALKPRVKIVAALDTLEYLYRGGRLNKATAAIGSFANLKPVITLTEEGAISIYAKCIGKNKAIAAILKFVEASPIDTDFPVYPIYTYGTDNTEALIKKAEKEGISPEASYAQVGATIGSHVGPGAYGFIYIGK